MLPAVILLDEAGRLLRPSIQQSDARCGSEVEDLKREVDAAAFVARAGNGLNQQLVAPKLRWIEKHEPDVFRKIATVFGSYDYINWRLTGERAVEKNWALEGGFVDVASGAIADDLVALAHIPRSALPRKSESHEILGHISAKAAAETGLIQGTPVVGGAADLIASALGAGITRKGDVLLKFGGSVDILIATDQPVADPRMYLDYHLVPGLYMPNGCMATGGTGLNWFVNTFATGERGRSASRRYLRPPIVGPQSRGGTGRRRWADRIAILPGRKNADSRSFRPCCLFWTDPVAHARPSVACNAGRLRVRVGSPHRSVS